MISKTRSCARVDFGERLCPDQNSHRGRVASARVVGWTVSSWDQCALPNWKIESWILSGWIISTFGQRSGDGLFPSKKCANPTLVVYRTKTTSIHSNICFILSGTLFGDQANSPERNSSHTQSQNRNRPMHLTRRNSETFLFCDWSSCHQIEETTRFAFKSTAEKVTIWNVDQW